MWETTVYCTMLDPHLCEDGLGDAEVQGWKANLEAGATWYLVLAIWGPSG